MVTYTVVAGTGKTAFAVEVNIAFEAKCATSQLGCLCERIIQQHLAVALSLMLRRYADWSHRHDWNFSAIICCDACSHEHVLADDPSIQQHYEIKFLYKVLVIPQLVENVVLQTSRAIHIPEALSDETFYFPMNSG